MICPVCGNDVFDNQDYKNSICPVCKWEYDVIQVKDPDFSGGANELSLKEYRKRYAMLPEDEVDWLEE